MRTFNLMLEITLIFYVLPGAYYLLLVLQLQFFRTSPARLEFSYFLNFSVWVNDSLPSMFTIIKHGQGKVLSFFLSKVLVYETNAQTPFYLLHALNV